MSAPVVIKGQVIGTERVVVKLRGTPERVMAAVRKTVRELAMELEALIKNVYLSGKALHRRTGRGARSVNTVFISTATSETARTGTNLAYMRAWELGAHIPAYEIVPRQKRALFWPGADHPVASVQRPARTMEPRPFLRPALNEMRPRIRIAIQAAAVAAAREG